MKKILSQIFLVFMFISFANANYDGEISIQRIFGDVTVETEFDGIINIDVGRYPLFRNDKVITRNGKAEIFTISGSKIKINEDSTLRLVELRDKNILLTTDFGSYYITCHSNYNETIQILASDAILMCNSNANFYLSLEKTGKLKISVYDGDIIFDRGSSKMTLKKADSIIIEKDNITWLKNTDNMNLYSYNETVVVNYDSYLPAELSVFAVELKRNGRWIYISDYGYCWLPLSISRQIWTPYQCGRWITRGGRQIWIACEPWGWLPHHYGRWIFIEVYGWLWVPPERSHVRWSPAHVVWFESPRGKGWIPLAPNEVYRGKPIRVDNSITINNRTYITINNNETRQQYRNLAFYNRQQRQIVDDNTNRFGNNQVNIQRNEIPFNRNNDARQLNEQDIRMQNNQDRQHLQRQRDFGMRGINQRRLPIIEGDNKPLDNMPRQIERPLYRENFERRLNQSNKSNDREITTPHKLNRSYGHPML